MRICSQEQNFALEVAPKFADLGVPIFEQLIPANRLTGYFHGSKNNPKFD